MTSRLMNATVELLRLRPRTLTLPMIAKDIGVSPYWLSMLVNGQIPNPSVVKIERLYCYLTKKELDL